MSTHLAADDTPQRREPKIVTPQEAALEALAHTREAAVFMHSAAERMERLFERMQTPAEIRPIPLTQASPVFQDKSHWEALSIGILNPSALKVYIGIGGGSPTLNARSPACPPVSLMVLPIRGYDLELGIDPADQGGLAAGPIVVFLMRYPSVQAAYVNKGS